MVQNIRFFLIVEQFQNMLKYCLLFESFDVNLSTLDGKQQLTPERQMKG